MPVTNEILMYSGTDSAMEEMDKILSARINFLENSISRRLSSVKEEQILQKSTLKELKITF